MACAWRGGKEEGGEDGDREGGSGRQKDRVNFHLWSIIVGFSLEYYRITPIDKDI